MLCLYVCVHVGCVCVCMSTRDVLFPGTGNTKSIVIHSALIWGELVGHDHFLWLAEVGGSSTWPQYSILPSPSPTEVTVYLSKKLVAALLANCVLCTFPRETPVKGDISSFSFEAFFDPLLRYRSVCSAALRHW